MWQGVRLVNQSWLEEKAFGKWYWVTRKKWNLQYSNVRIIKNFPVLANFIICTPDHLSILIVGQ
jgi:hypothetical protein